MSQAEPLLKLYREDVLLGSLSQVELFDWPWYISDFQPTPEFEAYTALFERELELLEGAGATPAWELAYERIEALKLTLLDTRDLSVTDQFVLHIEGHQARFKVW